MNLYYKHQQTLIMKSRLSIIITSLMLFSFFGVSAKKLDKKGGPSSSQLSIIEKQSARLFSSSLFDPKDPLPPKRFIFSVALTPDFKPSVPPLSLYFEKGIAKIASLGADIGFSYNNIKDADYKQADVLIGLRACGYAIPAIALFSGNNVNSFGFDPYLGLTYNYYITAISEVDEAITRSNAGVVIGTRWYPGNKRGFGLLAEYSSSGILGGNIRVGISLGR